MKKLIRFKALLYLVMVVLLINSCKKEDDDVPQPDPVDPAKIERDRIVKEYNDHFLGSTVSNPGWTGNTANCVAGTVPDDIHNKTLQRLKYFRRMAKLPDDVTFDAANNAKCQEAALMMSANNALNHYPPTSWSCYTTDGYTGASSSNLALGMNSSGAVAGFINDPGSNNTIVGHRRWLLYSKAKVMGHGSTSNACAIWVLGNSGNTPSFVPEFIAWPPSGYVPGPVVYPRWSFGIPSADFTNANVTMKDANNADVILTVTSKTATGVGDNTIVWEPTGINTTSTSDVVYHVSVTNVSVGGTAKNYNYDVTIIKP